MMSIKENNENACFCIFRTLNLRMICYGMYTVLTHTRTHGSFCFICYSSCVLCFVIFLFSYQLFGIEKDEILVCVFFFAKKMNLNEFPLLWHFKMKCFLLYVMDEWIMFEERNHPNLDKNAPTILSGDSFVCLFLYALQWWKERKRDGEAEWNWICSTQKSIFAVVKYFP